MVGTESPALEGLGGLGGPSRGPREWLRGASPAPPRCSPRARLREVLGSVGSVSVALASVDRF
eukprot:5602682-Alexandrium_andersonii.AAC.1